MRDLNVSDLVDRVNENQVSSFVDGMESTMRVQTDFSKDDFSNDWLEMFDFTLPYLDKIVRNPKRFIQNEEEIIKIEQAKKVGVETIKHLSKHTNFVQDIDENGDVIPSKLLNVLKEETFNTYENRFIYTLIQYMLQLLRIKMENQIKDPRLKDNKKMDYTSTTRIGDEKISVNVSLKTALDTSLNQDPHYQDRIKKVQDDIRALQFSEVYKALEKEDVPLVQNPIKKTNVILKNVNFQYAMKLWDFIMDQFTKKEAKKKQEKKDFMADAKVKGLIDETFLLQYLTVNSIGSEENKEEIEAAKERTISRMLDKIMELNPNLTKQQLQDKIGDQYEKIKTVRTLSKKDIEKIFRKHMDKYFEKISSVKI
mgnify:CR=1 FL=1